MEENIITIIYANGNKEDLEVLDINVYNNKTYAVCSTTNPEDTEVEIFRVEDIPGTDNANYIMETDEKAIQAIYNEFKKKYIGDIQFIDGK